VTTRAVFLARIRDEMAKTRGLFTATTAERPSRPRERLEILRRELIERWPHTLERFRAEFERVAAAGVAVHAMPHAVPAAAERQRLRELIAHADVGITGADLAIAETGTLVLRSAAGRPRSTSLLPPCHVALFERGALVETLAQVGIALEAWHDGPAANADGAVINFITGPSRTADIELTLTRGVHGPKEVHAIFVDHD
jgi:L-lactate dehydrogenase complex protein LldG